MIDWEKISKKIDKEDSFLQFLKKLMEEDEIEVERTFLLAKKLHKETLKEKEGNKNGSNK